MPAEQARGPTTHLPPHSRASPACRGRPAPTGSTCGHCPSPGRLGRTAERTGRGERDGQRVPHGTGCEVPAPTGLPVHFSRGKDRRCSHTLPGRRGWARRPGRRTSSFAGPPCPCHPPRLPRWPCPLSAATPWELAPRDTRHGSRPRGGHRLLTLSTARILAQMKTSRGRSSRAELCSSLST